MACENGHSKIAEMIIQKSTKFNIELNTKDLWGMTAFHMACQWGHSKIVEMLIKKSADFDFDLNAKTAEGWTAFHLAHQFGHKSIEEMLQSSKFSLSEETTFNNEQSISPPPYLNQKSFERIFKCLLCQPADPWAETDALKNHMIMVHGVDDGGSDWNKYFMACIKPII